MTAMGAGADVESRPLPFAKDLSRARGNCHVTDRRRTEPFLRFAQPVIRGLRQQVLAQRIAGNAERDEGETVGFGTRRRVGGL